MTEQITNQQTATAAYSPTDAKALGISLFQGVEEAHRPFNGEVISAYSDTASGNLGKIHLMQSGYARHSRGQLVSLAHALANTEMSWRGATNEQIAEQFPSQDLHDSNLATQRLESTQQAIEADIRLDPDNPALPQRLEFIKELIRVLPQAKKEQ